MDLIIGLLVAVCFLAGVGAGRHGAQHQEMTHQDRMRAIEAEERRRRLETLDAYNEACSREP